MGGWMLEVGKMALYISFPVAMFHFFNQPAYFEKWVTQKKREIYPPEDKHVDDEIKKTIRELRETRDIEILKALDEFENRQKS